MTLWTVSASPFLDTACGPEPALLARLTRSLTPRQAQHVAVITPQGLTANSWALQEALIFTSQAADNSAAPPQTALPTQFSSVQVQCCDEQSGPYRRVYSKPGYSYQRSRVYLPSDQKGELHEDKAAGDTAFIYLGGWGAAGGAVDAGLQHGHYLGGTNDDWAPFFLVQQAGGPSAVTVSTERQSSGAPWRLAAGQVAQLEFWVAQEDDLTVLSLCIAGRTNQDGTQTTLTLRAPVDPMYAWGAAGGGNILKRMTTIGQKTGQQNLSSGSYLRGVDWQESWIGQDAASAEVWRAEQTGGYCTFPAPDSPEGQRADGQGSKWQIDFVNAGQEKDTVELL